MTPLTNTHHSQPIASQPIASQPNVYPIMQQNYQSQQPVPVLPLQQQHQMSTAITPRHQVVAQLQQLQLQQQQQQQPQQQIEYYNVSSQQQQIQQQQQQQQQQRRRQFSRDSSRWSLLDQDDVTERDDCKDQIQVQFNKIFLTCKNPLNIVTGKVQQKKFSPK